MGKPPAADAIRDVIGRYFDRVRAGDTAGLADLFAPDAVIDYRDGAIVRGVEEVRAHFGRTVTDDRPPAVEVTSCMIDSPRCATEIHALYDRSQRERHAVDVFTFDDEVRISRLTVYWR
jgi:uncharacterized protein (TIGR02246 family)